MQRESVIQELPDQEVSPTVSKMEQGGARRKLTKSVRFCSKVVRQTIAGIKFLPRQNASENVEVSSNDIPYLYLYDIKEVQGSVVGNSTSYWDKDQHLKKWKIEQEREKERIRWE